jgi:hypothetical protein
MDREHEEWLGDHQMAHHKHAGVVKFRRAHKKPVPNDDEEARRRRAGEDEQIKQSKKNRELF